MNYTLTVNPTYDVPDGTSICYSDLAAFTWEGLSFTDVITENTGETQTTTKTKTLPSQNGCDSVVTYTLTIYPTFNLTDGETVCKGELPYHWKGSDANGAFDEEFTEAGSKTKRLTSMHGCDSVVTFTLTVQEPATVSDGESICYDELATYTWEGLSFTDVITANTGTTQTADKTVVLQTVNGCDSTVTFTLTVHPTYEGITDGSAICYDELDAFRWEGQSFTDVITANTGSIQTATKTATLQSINGCDSVVTYTLTVNPTYSVTDSKTICPGNLPFTWEGERFTTAGTKTKTLQSVNGCDSTVTFTLRVQQAAYQSTSDEVCDNRLPYHWTTYRTHNLTTGGEYKDTLKSSIGCDSIIYTLNLTVETERVSGTAVVEQEVCADSESFNVVFRAEQGRAESYALRFSPQAQAAGFADLSGAVNAAGETTITVTLPMGADSTQYIRPDDYYMTFSVTDHCGYVTDYPLQMRVLYPSWLIQQRWRDVLALYNSSYNGGYDFSLIRWYSTTGEILGQGNNNSYIYLTPRLNETAYWAVLTRMDDGKTIRTCDFYPDLKSPYYAPTGEKIRLLPRVQGDMRRVVIQSNYSGHYIVYDVTGKQMQQGQFGTAYGSPELQFAPATADGTYLIRFMTDEGEEEIKKWIVR